MQVFSAASLSKEDFGKILSFLEASGVIGFPADTAYGLGADAFNDSAVRRIFEIKGRPETQPILVLVNSYRMIETLAEFSGLAEELAERVWPGPLTMVLPALPNVSRVLTAGTGGIGVRWPAAPFAIRLLEAFGRPITATSANISGMPSCATADAVRAQLEGRLEMLIDGGTLPAPGGSTVLDLTRQSPTLLREGPVSFERLAELLQGNVRRLDSP